MERIDDAYVLSVDLGQSSDPTAIAVIHHKKHVHLRSDGHEFPAGETFDIRYLKRLPLGLSYVDQVDAVGQLLMRPPLNTGCQFVIDDTGVGRAVGDLFDLSNLKPVRVSITAGDVQTAMGQRRWHVPKSHLISILDARLHTGELRFAADLAEAALMAEELKDFRRKVSAAGRYSYEARVGKHDDLVLAVAIGLWALVGRPKPATAVFGVYSSTAPPLTYERN